MDSEQLSELFGVLVRDFAGQTLGEEDLDDEDIAPYVDQMLKQFLLNVDMDCDGKVTKEEFMQIGKFVDQLKDTANLITELQDETELPFDKFVDFMSSDKMKLNELWQRFDS